MTVVLLGDSHLARIQRDLWRIGPDIVNVSVGGATSRDLARQVALARAASPETIVLSIGTNDSNPRNEVAIDDFHRQVTLAVDAMADIRVVYFAPPGIDPGRISPGWGWTEDRVGAYRTAAISICDARGIPVIRADRLVAELGPRAFASDGLHLRGIGYRAAIKATRDAVR